MQSPMAAVRPPESLLFDESHVPMFIGTMGGRIVRVNRAFLELLGRAEQEVVGRDVEELRVRDQPPVDLSGFLDGTASAIRVERRFEGAGGRVREGRLVLVPFEEGPDPWVLCTFHDETPRIEAERRMRYEAFHDRMTGLPNRALFLDRLGQALVRDEPGAVVAVGLDRMRALNEAFGHNAGDRVVVEVSRRLGSAIQRGDTAARIGGDEFALLLLGELDEVTLDLVRAALSPRMAGELSQASISASLGIRPLAGLEAPELVLGDALLALQRAKELGRSRTVRYEASLRGRASRTADLAKAITAAIDEGAIDIDLQGVHRASDGLLAGFEALVRLRKSRLGPISPVEFVPIAEQRGLILPIGEAVMRQSLERLSELRSRPGGAHLFVAVNVSPVQVRDPAHMAQLGELIARSGVPPTAVKIEVTESVFVDLASDAASGLLALRELGVQLFLDDFGTGYSSLHHLANLRFDGLKADRSFVRQLPDDPRALTLLRSIAQLGAGLEMQTVAEGVETPAQAQALREAGFDLLQGFLFHRPEPARDVRP
jgi:diguanylate cyclase (GGDEF)-like protein/PAS domain S-box-containing protein